MQSITAKTIIITFFFFVSEHQKEKNRFKMPNRLFKRNEMKNYLIKLPNAIDRYH